MADEFSILSDWNKLLPAEKTGGSKDSLVAPVEREMSRGRRKGARAKKDPGVDKEASIEEEREDPDKTSGKIVDIII